MIQFSHNFTFGQEKAEINLDVATLPKASQEFLMTYGLRQYLSDGAAVGKDEAESEAERNKLKAGRVLDRVKKLQDGTMSVRGGGTRVTDPIQKIKRDIALEILKKHWRDNGIAAPKGAELTAKVEAFWERNGDKPSVVKILNERIKASQKMDLGELDI